MLDHLSCLTDHPELLIEVKNRHGTDCANFRTQTHAFGRLIPRNIVHAWGLGEMCILILCHLGWMQSVLTQLHLSLSSSGWIKSVGFAVLISMLLNLPEALVLLWILADASGFGLVSSRTGQGVP